LYGDVAELVLTFCQEFVDVGSAAAPTFMRKDRKLYEQYVKALRAGVSRDLEQVAHEADQCVATAWVSETTLVAACRQTKDRALGLRWHAPGLAPSLGGPTLTV
jgi:hypothetical protein